MSQPCQRNRGFPPTNSGWTAFHPLHTLNLAARFPSIAPLLNNPNSTAIARRIAALSIKSKFPASGRTMPSPPLFGPGAASPLVTRLTATLTTRREPFVLGRLAACRRSAFSGRAIGPSIGIPQKPKNREIPKHQRPNCCHCCRDQRSHGCQRGDRTHRSGRGTASVAAFSGTTCGCSCRGRHSGVPLDQPPHAYPNARFRRTRRVRHLWPAVARDGQWTPGSPGFDACRRTGGGGQVCR